MRNPVFILSSERSGSNLLRTLLSNHSSLSAPIAPHFLSTFQSFIHYYLPLEDHQNAKKLIDDMLALANHAYYDWGIDLDVDALLDTAQPTQFFDLFHLFYSEYQKEEGKKRFVCKGNDLFDFAFGLLNYYPNAQFIYLIRDPRDYAASFMHVPAVFRTPYAAAANWRKEQERCQAVIELLRLPVFQLTYRELVGNTELAIGNLLRYLDEPIEPACFQVQTEKNEKAARNTYWKNLNKPILSANTGKYRTQFNGREIEMIESTVKEQMLKFGYAFDTPAAWQKPRFFHLRQNLKTKIVAWREKTILTETNDLIRSRKALLDAMRARRRREWMAGRGITQP